MILIIIVILKPVILTDVGVFEIHKHIAVVLYEEAVDDSLNHNIPSVLLSHHRKRLLPSEL